MISYGRQSISQADIDAVVDVLRSDWLTQGPVISRFEQSVAGYCGARSAVACASGTAGLHLACLTLGVTSGDRVWTSPITFVASANCARYCGAEVDFVDIDPRTYNMCVGALERKLALAKREGRLPKVVIPVHIAGQSCDMATIAGLAQEYGFFVVEDAAHAIGGEYRSRKIGGCAHSDMTVFSFHPVKIVTTGEGGMVLTNDPKLAQRVALFASHGITRDPALMQEPPHGAWYYQQLELGYNFRMTDFQAALGVSQLKRIDDFIARRRALAARYNRALSDLPLVLPWQSPDSLSAWHLYVIRLQRVSFRKTRREVVEALSAFGIGAQVHYIPVHTQPYYRNLGFETGNFPEAEQYYDEVLSLPLYYDLSDEQQDEIVAALRAILA
jgi:UDP-4-amino-4,6-dideoxy-N-acetyl-beta-L-altrosamine transaminase